MTTLYEHQVLGSKIMVVSANFNIPFLVGNGNICLYESGITLLDEEGNEKYIIGLNEFKCRYETFINTRKMRYLRNTHVFTDDVSKCRNKRHVFKKVNGCNCGKFVINIPDIGDIELLDNHAFKYKKFYDGIEDLKKGVNPLDNIYTKKSFFSKLFKHKLF